MDWDYAKQERDPRRYWLEDKDCERLRRSEFNAVRSLLGAQSYVLHAKHDLEERLECIPHGKKRMELMCGALNSIAEDIVGTISRGQCQQLANTMSDFELRMVPKLTPMSQSVIFDKEIAKGIIDIAMEKCQACVEDGISCRECKLYQMLESTIPMDDYGDGLMCPYNGKTWEN